MPRLATLGIGGKKNTGFRKLFFFKGFQEDPKNVFGDFTRGRNVILFEARVSSACIVPTCFSPVEPRGL